MNVQSTGEVTAISPGVATVTVTIGSSLAAATVEVLAGVRPKQTDAEWDEEHKDDCSKRTETLYSTFGDSVPLPWQVLATNEASETAKTIYDYYSNAYGRMRYIDEYGFTASIQRRTEFEYTNDQSFLDAHLLRLVKWQRVYSGANLSQAIAMTRYFRDDYSIKGGMEY